MFQEKKEYKVKKLKNSRLLQHCSPNYLLRDLFTTFSSLTHSLTHSLACVCLLALLFLTILLNYK
jgi:hypothetical protein